MPKARKHPIETHPEYFSIAYLTNHYAKGMGERFIRDALKDKENPLPHFRVNRKTILIRKSDFDQWLETYRVDDGAKLDELVSEIVASMR